MKKFAAFLSIVVILTFIPFFLREGTALWYNANWAYRIKITTDSSNIAATETEMPLYLDLSLMPNDFFNNVKTDGSDIVVTTADEVTVIKHELVDIDTINKTGELHFKAPSISHTLNTDFYIYYGNPTALDSSSVDTWENYRAVWHLNEPKAIISNKRMAVATQAAMDGSDGGWAVFYGNDPVTTVLNLSVDEDQLSDVERAHTNEQVGYWAFDTNTPLDIKNSGGVVIGEIGIMENVGTVPTIQNLNNSYTSPVVITTPNLISNADKPAVVRMSGASATSFTAYMQNPGGINAPTATDIHYIVIEEGAHTLPGGFLMEAGIETVTGVNQDGDWGNGQMELINAFNPYIKPVVMGQVMTNNDPLWQSFWSSNGSQTGPATPGNIYIGRHVGADPIITRAAEDVGYIIIEESIGTTNGVAWVTDLGADTISGADGTAPYSYNVFGPAISNPIIDSTVNGFDAFFNSGVTAEIISQIGKGVTVNGGANGYMHISGLNYNNNNDLDELTASLWLKTTDTARSGILDFDRSEHWEIGLNFHNAAGQNGRISFDTASGGDGIKDLNSGIVINDGNWHHVTVVFDKNDITDKKIYIDGILSSSADQHSTGLGTGSTRYGFMGDGSEASFVNGPKNNLPYEGGMDEVRIQHSANSSERILTTYNNESNNAAFWDIGPQELLNSAPSAPTNLFVDHTSAQAGLSNPSDLTVGGVDNRELFFSAIYNDDDVADTANEARIQVSTDPTFGVITHWDSGWNALTDVLKGNRNSDIKYDNFGAAVLQPLNMNDGAVTYYWRMAFKDDGGLEGVFSAANMFTLMDPPTDPSGLSAMKIDGSPDVFDLQWADNSSNEDSFEIELKENTGSGFGPYMTLTGSPTTANMTMVSHTDTADDEGYMYRIKACNYAGCSGYEEDITTYYTDATVPDSVFGKYVSNNEFTLNYIDRSILEHVDIERCVGFTDCNAATFTLIEDDLASVKDDLASYTDNAGEIVANETFRWRVRGTDAGSNNSSEYTLSPYEYSSPANPSDVVVSYLTDNMLQIDWTDNSNYEDGFRIWVSENGGAFAEITPGSNTVGASVESYIFNTAQANKTYAFRVIAHVPSTSNNLELFSNGIDSPTVKTTPAASTGVSSSYIADNNIQVDWTENAFAEDGYKIHVSEDGGPEFLEATIGPNSNSYHFTGGATDHSYSFSVEAIINANPPINPTELNNKSTSTTPEIYTTPNAPDSLTVNQVFSNSIQWTNTDNSDIEKGFIYYQADATTEIFRLETPNMVNFTENGLLPNTQYTRTIAAFQTNPVNQDIISSTPALTSTYTLANPPNAVTSDFNGNTTITLTWDDGGNPAGTEFLAENITQASNSGWGTALNWDMLGLQCDITYQVEVKARNANAVESSTGIIDILHPCNSQENQGNGGGGDGGFNPPQNDNQSKESKAEEKDIDNDERKNEAKEEIKLEETLEKPIQTGLCEDSFVDIDTHKKFKHINHLYCIDVISGRQQGLFRPDEGSTRAEFLKMALGIYGYPQSTVTNQTNDLLFDDLSGREWHAPYISIGRQEGIVEGYKTGEFRPNQTINQAEALKILILAAGYEIEQNTEELPWYKSYEGIGRQERWLRNFVATANLTRAEAAEIISRTIEAGELKWLTK